MVDDVKRRVTLAALPASHTPRVIEALAPLPQFSPVESVLVTSLENVGPPSTSSACCSTQARSKPASRDLLPGWCHALGSPRHGGLTPSAWPWPRALGISVRSAIEFVSQSYGMQPCSLYEAIQANEAYRRIGGVPDLSYRYLSDDVPASSLPSRAPQAAGLPTAWRPASPSARPSPGRLSRAGRTLASMGLEGLDAADLLRAAQFGILPTQ